MELPSLNKEIGLLKLFVALVDCNNFTNNTFHTVGIDVDKSIYIVSLELYECTDVTNEAVLAPGRNWQVVKSSPF